MTASLLVLESTQVQICLAACEDSDQPVPMAWKLGHHKAHRPGRLLQNTCVKGTWGSEPNRWTQTPPVPRSSCVKSGLLLICK